MYLYKIYDINKNVVLEFKSHFLNVFEIKDLLSQDINYISCSRIKLKDEQITFFDNVRGF